MHFRNMCYLEVPVFLFGQTSTRFFSRQLLVRSSLSSRRGRLVVRPLVEGFIIAVVEPVETTSLNPLRLRYSTFIIGHSFFLFLFYHSLIPSFHHSIIPPFYHSIILSFCHSIIKSFHHSLILSFHNSLILSFLLLFISW